MKSICFGSAAQVRGYRPRMTKKQWRDCLWSRIHLSSHYVGGKVTEDPRAPSSTAEAVQAKPAGRPGSELAVERINTIRLIDGIR